jgi:hypothetical protein
MADWQNRRQLPGAGLYQAQQGVHGLPDPRGNARAGAGMAAPLAGVAMGIAGAVALPSQAVAFELAAYGACATAQGRCNVLVAPPRCIQPLNYVTITLGEMTLAFHLYAPLLWSVIG